MGQQLQLVQPTILRDACLFTNPVTSVSEPYTLIESGHVFTMSGTDQMATGGGGSATGLASLFRFAQANSFNNIGPDGAATAMNFGPNGTYSPNPYCSVLINNLNSAFHGWAGPVSGNPWSCIATVKAGTLTQAGIAAVCISGSTAGIGQGGNVTVFDLTTGAIVGADPNSGAFKSQSLGNGWWGLFAVGQAMNVSVDNRFAVYACKNGSYSWNCTVADTILLGWCSQFETSSVPTLPFSGVAPGLDNSAQGKFPYYNPVTPGADVLAIPLGRLSTPQSLTIYMEWLDRGNASAASAAVPVVSAPGVLRLGDIANTASSAGINIVQGATGFTGTYTNGGATSVSTLVVTPTWGQLVGLRATVNALGALTLFGTLNGGAEVKGSTGSAISFPSAWSDSLLIPGSNGLSNPGDMALRRIKGFAGVKPLAICKA